MNTLPRILFGRDRGAVLSYLFLHQDESFYIREIARRAQVLPGNAKRELTILEQAGLVTSQRRGNQVFYTANLKSPIYSELQSIVRKTFGLGDVLREALQPLAAKIRFAFVFGSMARAKESSSSDVDVCIVGDASFEESVILLRSAERILGREVNPVAYSETEIREKLRANNPFAREIVRGPKVWLIGDQDELGAMA